MTHHADTLLTIAGTDPSSGAGIQVDLQVFAKLGFHGTSVITALLWQDTRTVSGWHIPPPEVVAHQLDVILKDIPPTAIKIGVLPTPQIVEAVASRLPTHCPIVHDPVLESGDGTRALVTPGTLDAMRLHLFPHVTLLTPNIPEAMTIIHHAHKAPAPTSLTHLAERVREVTGVAHVLLKAGHAKAHGDMIHDVLASASGTIALQPLPRHALERGVRGTGCQLSSALAAHLARGLTIQDAANLARRDLWAWLGSRTFSPGQGRDVIGHFEIQDE